MKRILIVTITVFFAVMVTNVQAADVAINPGSVELTIESGNSAVANLVVNANSRAAYIIDLRVGSAMTGNMPSDWLRPVNVHLAARRGGTSSANMNLMVNVPVGTPGGTYTAQLPPQILRATERVVSSGVTVIIEVPSQEKCIGAPVFKNVLFGPEDIWAPKSSKAKIEISGAVDVAPGCEVTGTYSMESDDGPATGEFTIDADGNFALEIVGKFSKNGKDKKGTIYNGKLTVVDANKTSVEQGFFVTVGHDRGK